MALLAGEPCRRHEAHGSESVPLETGEPPSDPLTGTGRIEGEKLAFIRGATPCAQAVTHRPGEPCFIVPLTMEHDLGALGRPGAQPPGKFRVAVEWPGAVPVGHHEQRGDDPTLDA